jgi:hypothetical protein
MGPKAKAAGHHNEDKNAPVPPHKNRKTLEINELCGTESMI